ncbi:hypothetical protein PROFUN_07033 [Planoprotostelium fungivorum]|uniref:Uncharacterized protein n=1 Tax=Planoprotostelium fungivorum TaxID=1890364 RepID=A0A2P6NMS1_9EUKA|nr:hypothetical protein PROFUN_07033 [Planoprotostelium fungivorum]
MGTSRVIKTARKTSRNFQKSTPNNPSIATPNTEKTSTPKQITREGKRIDTPRPKTTATIVLPDHQYTTYLTKSGLRHQFDVTPVEWKKFGFQPNSRVITPRGAGTVIGVRNHHLWIHVDIDSGASFWTSGSDESSLRALGIKELETTGNDIALQRVKEKIDEATAAPGPDNVVVDRDVQPPLPTQRKTKHMKLKDVIRGDVVRRKDHEEESTAGNGLRLPPTEPLRNVDSRNVDSQTNASLPSKETTKGQRENNTNTRRVDERKNVDTVVETNSTAAESVAPSVKNVDNGGEAGAAAKRARDKRSTKVPVDVSEKGAARYNGDSPSVPSPVDISEKSTQVHGHVNVESVDRPRKGTRENVDKRKSTPSIRSVDITEKTVQKMTDSTTRDKPSSPTTSTEPSVDTTGEKRNNVDSPDASHRDVICEIQTTMKNERETSEGTGHTSCNIIDEPIIISSRVTTSKKIVRIEPLHEGDIDVDKRKNVDGEEIAREPVTHIETHSDDSDGSDVDGPNIDNQSLADMQRIARKVREMGMVVTAKQIAFELRDEYTLTEENLTRRIAALMSGQLGRNYFEKVVVDKMNFWKLRGVAVDDTGSLVDLMNKQKAIDKQRPKEKKVREVTTLSRPIRTSKRRRIQTKIDPPTAGRGESKRPHREVEKKTPRDRHDNEESSGSDEEVEPVQRKSISERRRRPAPWTWSPPPSPKRPPLTTQDESLPALSYSTSRGRGLSFHQLDRLQGWLDHIGLGKRKAP